MSLNINKNFGAISNGALTSLNSHQTAMGKAITRVSTGMRVNSPADDVSAYLTSRKIKADSDGYTALYNGLQSGSAKLNAADSAISSVLDVLNAMKSKALQYQATDSNDTTAQSAVKTEYDNLYKVLGSALNVQYNGEKILEGQTMSFYTAMYDDTDIGEGAGIYGTDSASFSVTKPADSGTVAFITSADGSKTYGTVGSTTGQFVYMNTTYSLTTQGGGIDTSTSYYVQTSDGTSVGIMKKGEIGWYADHYKTKVNSGNVQTYSIATNTGLVSDSNNLLYGKIGTGANTGIVIDGKKYTINISAYTSNTAGVVLNDASEVSGAYNFDSSTNNLYVSIKPDAEIGKLTATWSGINTAITSNKLNDVTDDDIISNIKKAIDNVTQQQANLNAATNAMEYATSYLSNAANAQDLAYTSITEADMAKEMTSYVKNNVMAQAAQAMIAQANQSMASVLNLLQ